MPVHLPSLFLTQHQSSNFHSHPSSTPKARSSHHNSWWNPSPTRKHQDSFYSLQFPRQCLLLRKVTTYRNTLTNNRPTHFPRIPTPRHTLLLQRPRRLVYLPIRRLLHRLHPMRQMARQSICAERVERDQGKGTARFTGIRKRNKRTGSLLALGRELETTYIRRISWACGRRGRHGGRRTRRRR